MRINTTIASLAVVVSMGCTCTPQAKHEPAEQRIAVTGVSLTRSEMQLAPGDNFKLVARVSPANATDPSVRWSSDQPEIVAIDAESGEARALAQGDASVTVTTTDGSFTASCSVKVSGASVKPVDPEKPVGPENPENPGTPSDPGAPSGRAAGLWRRPVRRTARLAAPGTADVLPLRAGHLQRLGRRESQL